MKLSFLSLAGICAVILAVPVWAHHSHGHYDTTEWTPFEGTVKEVHLINPHAWIYLEVRDDNDQPTVWALEATGPQGLQRNGINPEDVLPGDTIEVQCHRLRDGSNATESTRKTSYRATLSKCSAIGSETAPTDVFSGM